ncbi:LiaF transmembrane domain-containing protein [Guggenheimella bovis]
MLQTYWPLLFIFFGIVEILRGGKDFGGVFMMLVGGFFLAMNFGYQSLLQFGVWFWACVLIAIAALATSAIRRPRAMMMKGRRKPVLADEFKAKLNFKTQSIEILSEGFKGANLRLIFSDLWLDFGAAKIKKGAVLNVKCYFSTFSLSVPEDTRLIINGEVVREGKNRFEVNMKSFLSKWEVE